MASTAGSLGKDVCIVGAGALGLVASKNLKEQGLQPTVFERNEFIAGTWHVSERDQTSALEWTTLMTSTHTSSFTDFPFPKDHPAFASAKQVERYLESYASHFDLLPHIKLLKSVTRIKRDAVNRKWVVTVKDVKDGSEETHAFSRVIIATGILSKPNIPRINGVEMFKGEVIHSRAFKDPSKYEGKRVVVVGIGATGADTIAFLKDAKAAKIYLSHRSQILLTPKSIDGKPFDQQMTHRFMTIIQALGSIAPSTFINLMSKAVVSIRRKAFPWLNDHPSFNEPRPFQKFLHRIPMTSSTLAESLRDDDVETVFGIQEITGPHSLTMSNGKILEDIDAIIFCTGYDYDFSLIHGVGSPIDPTMAPDHFEKIKATKYYNPENPFPRLYQGIISEQFPESLAILGHAIMMGSLFVIYDIYTMALASLWAGNYPQASAKEMAKDIDTQYNFVVDLLKEGPVPHLGFRLVVKDTWNWMHTASGTGITECLASFKWAAWKLWWSDRRFYNLLMDGITVPAMHRLFDTGRGRKPWAGARAQILAENEQAKALVEDWKKQNRAND